MGKRKKEKTNKSEQKMNTGMSAPTIDLSNSSWEKHFDEAKDLYKKGVNGDVGAARKALELLEVLHRQIPENTLIEAYYGGAYVLSAREENNLVNKGKKSSQGLKILDSAFQKEPDDIQIRILHAYVLKNLPDWLNRGPDAIEDFLYLKSRYEAAPGIFNADLYEKIQSDIEEIRNRLGAIPPHVQKIYASFSKMGKKK